MQPRVQLDVGRRPYDLTDWNDRLAIKSAIFAPRAASAFQFREMQRCVQSDPWLFAEALLGGSKPFMTDQGMRAVELWSVIELAYRRGKDPARPLAELRYLETTHPELVHPLSPTQRPGDITTAVQPT